MIRAGCQRGRRVARRVAKPPRAEGERTDGRGSVRAVRSLPLASSTLKPAGLVSVWSRPPGR